MGSSKWQASIHACHPQEGHPSPLLPTLPYRTFSYLVYDLSPGLSTGLSKEPSSLEFGSLVMNAAIMLSVTTNGLTIFIPSQTQECHIPWYSKHLKNPVGRTYDRFANHFDPCSPIFTDRERLQVVISDVGILTTTYVFYSIAKMFYSIVKIQ
ncbi:hypothetical protein Tsubulata_016623, partial [Turnera subulata]